MTVWDRLADLVVTRPGRVLAVALVPVVLPLLALPSMRASHDILSVLPPDAESVAGLRAIEGHMPPGETAPVVIVVDGDSSIYDPTSFRALGDLSRNLRRLPTVATVRSAAMPTGGRRPDVDPAAAEELTALSGGLREAAVGARELEGGIRAVRDAVAEIDRRLPGLAEGLPRAVAGVDALAEGVAEAGDGVGALQDGVGGLRSGVARARQGAGRLRTDVAEPAAAALDDAVDALSAFTVGRTDPMYERAYESVGEAYGRVTGRYPVGHPQAGQRVDPGYDGLAASLRELESGLGQVEGGLGEIDAGLGRLRAGLREVSGGLAELRSGLEEAADGVARLRAGIRELLAGIDARLLPGAGELADGLARAATQVEESGLGELVVGGDEGPFVLTAGMLEALPEVREQLGFFVTDDETRTRLFVGLAESAFSEPSIASVPAIEETARRTLLDSPLADAEILVTGSSAFMHEVDEAVKRDFPLIVVAVVAGVFVVLALLLRSLVAPVYMMATVLLTYGAALGLTTIVFQGLLGHPGIHWWIPSLLFVLLVALGVDYNIFLMGRVREEADRLVTREAVAEGIRHTGRVITSAGVILAGTFGAMMSAPMRSLVQMGFAAMTGILIDTFVVRAALVPSVAVMLGRHSWWPSARAAAD